MAVSRFEFNERESPKRARNWTFEGSFRPNGDKSKLPPSPGCRVHSRVPTMRLPASLVERGVRERRSKIVKKSPHLTGEEGPSFPMSKMPRKREITSNFEALEAVLG